MISIYARQLYRDVDLEFQDLKNLVVSSGKWKY